MLDAFLPKLEDGQVDSRFVMRTQNLRHELLIAESTVLDIIQHYTRESGVRNLEREIAKICRKSVKQLALEKDREKITVTTRNLDSFLGVRRFRTGSARCCCWTAACNRC